MDSLYAEQKLDTGILYAGNNIEGIADNPDSPPIHFATAYAVADTEDYDIANTGGKYFYNRSANPNRDCLGKLISYLEKGEQTIITSAGMAAISATLLGLCERGDHILCNSAIYGEVVELADNLLVPYGLEFSQVDFTDPEAVEQAIRPNTRILYTEIIANPLTTITDIRKIACIGKTHGIITVVDSTFTTPVLIRPIEHGADVVIHSLTKYFGGHSDISGGSVTASKELIGKMMHRYLLLGGILDPYSSWLCARSIRTMSMRVRKQNENAKKIAAALANHPNVHKVNHPSLPDHPQHKLAKEILDDELYGAIISFRVDDDLKKVDDFMHRLQIIQYLGTLGGIRTSVMHPGVSFMHEFSTEQLHAMGMYDGLIRISTGAEDPADLIEDLTQALKAFD